eukprot:g25710.t1
MVKWYNKLKQTVLEVEFPLIYNELEAIDDELKAAEETITWQSENCWNYIVRMTDTVHDLASRVQKTKENVETLHTLMKAWSESAMFTRKDNRRDNLLNLEDREDRVAKWYKLMRDDGVTIHKLVE